MGLFAFDLMIYKLSWSLVYASWNINQHTLSMTRNEPIYEKPKVKTSLTSQTVTGS